MFNSIGKETLRLFVLNLFVKKYLNCFMDGKILFYLYPI